ncbi:hypothetical protein WHR41_00699 [Cladosporium halotolerans]|uniref:Heterokaryon incompatibility domain-containing protein n=1 Tax=Cladosporium halotolerans TaxID=1052096 RepID=A0AB34L6K6_9PEZI
MAAKAWSSALYGPLPLSDDHLQTRFLRIRRGESDTPLECTLFRSTLVGANYEALSYTWGTDERSNLVLVNGIHVGVTKNLQAALLALRQLGKSCVVWIDALCINQEDANETAAQVQQMGNIYRCAHRVIVWLGVELDGSSDVFEYMRWYQAVQVIFEKGPTMTTTCTSLSNLLKRRYWSQVWIVQEVALGTSNHLIMCGNDRLDWPTFVSAALDSGLPEDCNRLRVLQEIRAKARIPPRLRYAGNQLPGAFEIRQSYADNLFYLLNRTHNFDATDPRDKLFALLARILLMAFLHGSRIFLQNELPPCLDLRASTA